MITRVKPAWIGTFVVAGIALLLFGVARFGQRTLSKHTVEFVSFFPQSVTGLQVGAAVKFRGVVIGEVKGIYLQLPASKQAAKEMMIPVVYVVDQDLVTKRGSKGAIDDPAYWQGLFDQGFRAELAVESFVTGLRFISFDLHPNSPMRFVRDSITVANRIEVPTFESGGVEEIQAKMVAVLDNLAKADLVTLVASLNKLAVSANDMANSPRTNRVIGEVEATLIAVRNMTQRLDTLTAILEPEVKPLMADARGSMSELKATLVAVRTTLETVRAAADPGSPSAVRLNEALAEFEKMARSIRALSEYVERNPAALLRGRAVPPPKEKTP